MAQTRTGYRSIDDTEVDPDSPVTQTLMEGLRDQWYGALADGTGAASDERVKCPDRIKTTETDTRKVLRPKGSGSDVEWASISSQTGGSMATGSTTVSTVKTVANDITISNSDDTDYIVKLEFVWVLYFTGYTEHGHFVSWIVTGKQ